MAVKLQNYGQVRTLADIAKALNEQHHYNKLKDFYEDLEQNINDYLERGTITDDSLESFKLMMDKNADSWFSDGHFDTDQMFAHLENEIDNDASTALDLIYARRAYAKLGHIVLLMNEIARYTDPQTLMDDIHMALESKTDDCSENYYDWEEKFNWNDDFVIYGIQYSLKKHWQLVIDNEKHLDNDKLEKFLIGKHEMRVSTLGLDEVIRRDYESDYCQTQLMYPKTGGTGPIYWDLEDGNYFKLCSATRRQVFPPGKYELPILTPVLERLCQGDDPEYIHYYSIYLPIRDFSRPIYNGNGKVVFRTETDKRLYLMRQLKEYKAQQKKDEQP